MKKKTIYHISFCLLLSFVLITLCSKSSFLYVFNDWHDANIFLTMGKGIFSGNVIYRDLFEQKGPIIYLIYGIGYLISHTSFFGVYLLEVVSFTIFLYYAFKTLSFFVKEKYIYPALLLFGMIMVTTIFFQHGGSAEEFCLPMLSFSFYSFIKSSKEGKYTNKTLFMNGLMAGLIALTKFTLLGFWFIWMALVFFDLIFKKEYKRAFLSCLIFLGGMFTPIVLCLIYFAVNHGLKDFIEAYITFNVKAYASDVSLLGKLKQCVLNFKMHMLFDKRLLCFICIGMITTLFTDRIFKEKLSKIFVVLSFLTLGFFIYIGGSPYNYYFLLNAFWILPGIGFIFVVIDEYFFKEYKKQFLFRYIVLILLVSCVVFLGIRKSSNIPAMKLKKSDYAQFVFGDIIKKEKNATLLNYDALDSGFYFGSGTMPTTKYFMRQNIDSKKFPILMKTQDEIVRNKKVDFVVVREYPGIEGYHKKIKVVNENYDLIRSFTQSYEGATYHFYLYKKKK